MVSDSDLLRDQWAQARGLRQSKKSPHCVCRLLNRVCPHYGASNCPNSPPEVDHPSLWCRDRKPVVFVFQPYGLNDAGALVAFCLKRGLACRIAAHPAWHYPTRVLHIEISRDEAAE